MTVLAQMDREDLLRWRMVVVRFHALQLNPGVYSQRETEEILRDKLSLEIEFASKYDLPPDQDWHLDPISGVVYVN